MATSDAASQRECRARKCRHGRGPGITRLLQTRRSSRRDRDGRRRRNADAWNLDRKETSAPANGERRRGDPWFPDAGALDRLVQRRTERDTEFFFAIRAGSNGSRERAQLTLHLRFEERVGLLDSETFERSFSEISKHAAVCLAQLR